MTAVVLINAWKYFPFMVVLFLAALQAIPNDIYEAARVDGAASWHLFRYIKFPLILPTVVVVTMLRSIFTFNDFEMIFLLTAGGPMGRTETLPILLYRMVFTEFSLGRGTALATIILAMLMVMVAFYWRAYKWSVEQ